MMAHGFALEFLAGLVRDGLVSERADRVEMGKCDCASPMLGAWCWRGKNSNHYLASMAKI